MSRFNHCVVFFPETRHYGILDKGIISGKITIGKTLSLSFPIRRDPFEAVVKNLCQSKEEAETIAKGLIEGSISENSNAIEERSCSWSPEPHKNGDSPENGKSHHSYVTSDLFCDVMNRVVEVLKEMQSESSVRLEACIKQMAEVNSKLSSNKKSDEGQEENEREQELVSKPKPTIMNQGISKSNQSRSQTSLGARWPPTSGSGGNIVDDDLTSGPSWEFVSKEKVDEVYEDCENYKIFARKISYAIFDEHEQRLKMNERNKKKVSELRKIIRLKYPSERREFDDMIWRTCKNAVNNTTYNEAKRRKRHPALMLGTEASGQNYLSGTYEANDHMGTPSKRLFDSGHDPFPKAEPASEFSEL